VTLLDGWAGDQPELQAGLARRRADTSAWHAWNQLDRATGAVRQALDDDAVGPEWRDQLRSKCLEAGALAVGQVARRHAVLRQGCRPVD
jgi:hypothetical protein